MKQFLFLIAFICSINAFAEPYSYTIVQHPYRFSTYFEMQGKNGFEGRAIKSSLSLKTTYDIYDSRGAFQARGAVQLFSLGTLFAWGKDIDVYDTMGNQIGFIDGETLTTAQAKYAIYNHEKERIATAYLDYNCNGFIITSFPDERTLAYLRRNFIQETTDSWDVTIFETEAIDARILKVFSAFAIDYQASFKEDT